MREQISDSVFVVYLLHEKYLLGQLGTNLKGQATFDLLCWQDQICLNLGFVVGLECITWEW